MNEDERLPAQDNGSPFERIRRKDAAGAEYWSSRDFAQVLGYLGNRNFEQVAKKVKTACFNRGQHIENHFVDITEMVESRTTSEDLPLAETARTMEVTSQEQPESLRQWRSGSHTEGNQDRGGGT